MTRVIAQNGDDWTLRKIRSLVDREAVILQKQIGKIEEKIAAYEDRYGKLYEALHGRVDEMELLEWEGEVETMRRLRENLDSLERIAFGQCSEGMLNGVHWNSKCSRHGASRLY